MKIILLKDVPKVGKMYDTKDVNDGYALNMLIPKKLAVIATPAESARINAIKAKIQGEIEINHELLMANLGKLDGTTISIAEKANEKGHLFAGLHKPEILSAIEKQVRVNLNAEHILLDKPIKEAGVHDIQAKGGNKVITFKLEIKTK